MERGGQRRGRSRRGGASARRWRRWLAPVGHRVRRRGLDDGCHFDLERGQCPCLRAVLSMSIAKCWKVGARFRETALHAKRFRPHRRDASERARGIGRMWWWCNYPTEGARLLGAELLIGCLVRRCGRECALARCPRRTLGGRWWLHLCTTHCHFSRVSGARGAVVSGSTNQGVPGELTADTYF